MGFDLKGAIQGAGRALANLGGQAAGAAQSAGGAFGQAAEVVQQTGNAAGQATRDAGASAAAAAQDVGEKVVKGDFGGAAQAATAALAGAPAELQHIADQLTQATRDAVASKVGANATLTALAKGMRLEDFYKLVAVQHKDLIRAVDELMVEDFDTVSVPSAGPVAMLFPASARGGTMHWTDARKTPEDTIWYVAALALTELDRLKDNVGKALGVKLP